MKGFDLGSLESADTTVVDLLHPATGEPIGATITVYSKDSEICRAARRKAEAKFLEFSRKHGGKKYMPAEDREKLDLAADVASVQSWDGLTEKGKALECTQANVLSIFERFPCFREQCKEATEDRALFIKS